MNFTEERVAVPLTNFPFVVGSGYGLEQIENLRKVSEVFPHWQLSDGHGKRPKAPYKLDGSGKGWDDPASAATLDAALDAVASGRAGCVGLLSHSGARGFVVLDFDKVLNEGTFDKVGALVLEHFKAAYTELSPSGAGLRVVCQGTVSPGTFKGTVKVDGSEHSFELYEAGASSRFLRMTGAAVAGTGGAADAECQPGIDWALGCIRKAAPDKVKTGGAGPRVEPPDEAPAAHKQSSAEVFAQVAELRPALEPEEVLADMQRTAAAKPRSKLAEALRGNLKPWSGDHSAADFFIVSEAVRRGAGSVEDVVAVWGSTALGVREKFKQRAEYRDRTANDAARVVLAELLKRPDNANVGGSGGGGAALPDQVRAGIDQVLAAGEVLTFTPRGGLMPTVGNVLTLLRSYPTCAGLFGFDELMGKVVRLKSLKVLDRDACAEAGPLTDDDLTRVVVWLNREFRMAFRRDEAQACVRAAARGRAFNPLRNRLHELRDAWDGKPRVAGWLQRYLLVEDGEDGSQRAYVDAVGMCFMVSAAARSLQPGCKVDASLSLEGSPGGGKSTAFSVLADALLPDLFTDGLIDASSQTHVVEAARGKLIVELAELAAVRRASDVEALKSSLTRRADNYRAPYSVESEDVRRGFVFVATTNQDSGYLSDDALLRRFWTVRSGASETQRMPLDELRAIAGQLWGEAVHLFERGQRWWIDESDGAAFEQWRGARSQRREDGAFFEELIPVLLAWAGGDPAERLPMKTIAERVGDSKSAEGGMGAQRALAESLKRHGLERVATKYGKRWWLPPAAANKFAGLAEQGRREAAGK